ncbi:MAG: hypothetical protein AABX65_01700 [Nanoarchaeota archaeon]
MWAFDIVPWRKFVFKRKMKETFKNWEGLSIERAEEDFRRHVQDYVFGRE